MAPGAGPQQRVKAPTIDKDKRRIKKMPKFQIIASNRYADYYIVTAKDEDEALDAVYNGGKETQIQALIAWARTSLNAN